MFVKSLKKRQNRRYTIFIYTLYQQYRAYFVMDLCIFFLQIIKNTHFIRTKSIICRTSAVKIAVNNIPHFYLLNIN